MSERQCCILYRVLVSLAIAVVVALTVAGAKLGIDERIKTDGPIPAYAGDTGPVIPAGAGEDVDKGGAEQCPCGCKCTGGTILNKNG